MPIMFRKRMSTLTRVTLGMLVFFPGATLCINASKIGLALNIHNILKPIADSPESAIGREYLQFQAEHPIESAKQ